MAVNATLATIAKHGAAGEPGSSIYQVTSSVVNPLYHRNLLELFYEHVKASPFIDSMGRLVPIEPFQFFNTMEEFSAHISKHVLSRAQQEPSVNFDTKFSGKLEKLVRKSVERGQHLATIYKPYAFYKGRFDNSNVKSLMGCISEEETREFGFDVEGIDWNDYILNVHIPGVRKHVMKGRGM